MATIIDFAAERRKRSGTTFTFDLASPWTYLAAAAVTDDFPAARWLPATSGPGRDDAGTRSAVERAARDLGVRFAWPQEPPEGLAAARAAAFAAEHGRAREFALGAARLAWGWGQDLDDHALVAQAAGIAELPLDAVLEASFDPRRDGELRSRAATDGAPVLATAGVVLDGFALVAAHTGGEVRRAR